MLKKIIGIIWRNLPPPVRRKIVRGTQTKFTVSAAAIIVNEKGKVLLLDHVLRPASGWGIPGGFLDAGEQAADAVRRELREEASLELEDLEMVGVRTSGQHVEIIFRAAPVGAVEIKSREINGFGWFALSDIPKEMSQSQKSIVETLLKNNL